MLSSRTKLEICQKLFREGFKPELYTGARIARGFADLGFEEFSLLAGDKIVSLLTGETSSIQPDQTSHFFLVPSLDEILNFIHKSGVDIESLHYRDQRIWEIAVRNVHTGARSSISDSSLDLALLKVLFCGSFS